MNKKLVLGSSIVVVILVMMSVTGVIGYQTTSTTMTKASPLFNVRSKRAIDEESNDLTCDYVGKGDNINLLFPNRNVNNRFISNLIDIINKLNQESKKRITDSVIEQLLLENIILYNNNEIENTVHEFFKNPEIFMNTLSDNNSSTYNEIICPTPYYTVFYQFIPICFIPAIFYVIAGSLWALYMFIYVMLFGFPSPWA